MFELGKPKRPWRILAGFLPVTVLSGAFGIVALDRAHTSSTRLAAAYQDEMLVVVSLRSAAEREAAHGRAFLVTGDSSSRDGVEEARRDLHRALTRLSSPSSDEEARLLAGVEDANAKYERALDDVLTMMSREEGETRVREVFEVETAPSKERLTRTIDALQRHAQRRLRATADELEATHRLALTAMLTVAIAALAVAAMLALQLGAMWRRAAQDDAERTRLLERLAQSNRDLDAFAGRVAHDVRNALSPLEMAAAIIRSPYSTRPAVESAIASSSRAVERSRTLVESLLAFSRAGQPVDPCAHCSLRAVTQETLDDLAPSLRSACVHVEDTVSDDELRCPAELLRIVLTNVVGNAVKFVRDCDERNVSISSACRADTCSISVRDSGPGIPVDEQRRLFEPFFRGRDVRAPGTGIGLATVQRIVEAYGGRVSVDSVLGHGATFQITLPLAMEPAPSTS